jgi:hypothetical protein
MVKQSGQVTPIVFDSNLIAAATEIALNLLPVIVFNRNLDSMDPPPCRCWPGWKTWAHGESSPPHPKMGSRPMLASPT